jgi:hypothetical protein
MFVLFKGCRITFNILETKERLGECCGYYFVKWKENKIIFMSVWENIIYYIDQQMQNIYTYVLLII